MSRLAVLGLIVRAGVGARVSDRRTLVLRRAGRAALAVALLAVGALLGFPAAAGAHAAFVSSRPQPGAELSSAPGVVEVEFSEPLIQDLSSVAVTDPDGRVWERSGVDERSMRVALSTNSAGVYEVGWKTVSPVDGHTLRGSFRFGVGVAPEQAEAAGSMAPRTSDLLLAVARAVEYAGLLAAVGMLAVGWLAGRDPSILWVRLRPVVPLGVALMAGVVVVVGEALLASPAVSAAAVGRYLSAEPGVPRVTRLAAEAAAVAAVRFGARTVAAPATTVAVIALAAGGHAAAARPAWWGITVDGVHLLAAGLWAGGVLALATQRPPGGWRSQDAGRLLARFSPLALGAFLATVASGTVRGIQELTGFSDLLTTSYGQVLTFKVVAVALMVPLSVRAWRRHHARPRAEGALALVAVAAAALLAAYPVPPQRAAEDAPAQAGGPNPALPQEGDLTFGGDTGDVLVGLTVRPGRPGGNEVFVYLLPSSGEQAAADLSVELVAGGDTVALQPCGATCRRSDVQLDAGAQTVAVRVVGVDDEPATFHLPDLPAPDATAILDRVDGRMAAVGSLRYDEVLGPLDPPLQSTVAIVRPDRIDVTIHTLERQTIRIGDDRYERHGDQPWQVVTRDGARVQVPAYIWDEGPRIAPRTVGAARIAEAHTTIVSFFIDHTTGPIWYRLWVDDEGLVRRAEMRARGHFMDHDYDDFDTPISIEAPL